MSPDLARKALEAAPDATIIIDATGTIRFSNRQTTVMFGYAHDDIIGLSVEKLLPQRFRARHVSHRQRFFESSRVRPMGVGLDLFALRKDGTEFPVEISLSPLEDDDRMLVAASIRDVTERKRVEAELSNARDIANRANQAKSRFLATASHDLRQPLQTLALLNGTLRRTSLEALAEDVLAQQEQAVDTMSRLLNALLDINKLESGAIKPHPSDFIVSDIFEEMRREFSSLAQEKGLELRVASCEESVHSDPSLVGQILRNLLANSIKYTQSGWVALGGLREPPFVRLEVLDTGIGIPADQLRYIYDEFFQVGAPHNPARQGYGLGLSIVQRLVTLLGLKLDAQSEIGRGSLFALTLPASVSVARPARRIETRPPVDTAPKQARILLVEDDAAVRSATRLLLRSEGYQVADAGSLAEALEHARHDGQVDLLVTDYHLGDGETGIQVISSVRKALHPSLSAILITGDTSSAIQALAPDPLMRIASKPVNAEELLSLIRALLVAH